MTIPNILFDNTIVFLHTSNTCSSTTSSTVISATNGSSTGSSIIDSISNSIPIVSFNSHSHKTIEFYRRPYDDGDDDDNDGNG